jgi:hypothetical protein
MVVYHEEDLAIRSILPCCLRGQPAGHPHPLSTAVVV